MAKAGANLFLLEFEYSGSVSKLFGTDFINKVSDRESFLMLLNTCQTNQVSREYYETRLAHEFSCWKLFL